MGELIAVLPRAIGDGGEEEEREATWTVKDLYLNVQANVVTSKDKAGGRSGIGVVVKLQLFVVGGTVRL